MIGQKDEILKDENISLDVHKVLNFLLHHRIFVFFIILQKHWDQSYSTQGIKNQGTMELRSWNLGYPCSFGLR